MPDTPESARVDGGITIHLDLAELWVAQEGSFPEYLAGLAATRLIQETTEARTSLRKIVESLTEDEVRERLRPLIAEAIDASLTPTDSFGQAKGEPRTLREVIVDIARRQLGVTKDRGSVSMRRATLVEEIIEHEVRQALTKELKDDLDAAKQQVRQAVRERGAEMLTETIERLGGRA